MQNWMSQIVIGVIVTVVGTVIANAIISGKGGRNFFGGGHYSGPARSGRENTHFRGQPHCQTRDRFCHIVFGRDTPGWLRESGCLDAREGGRDGKK